jgi:hypothetical protein
VITAIRYVASPERAPLQGAPLVSAIRVFYDLPALEVLTALAGAVRRGVDGVSAADLVGFDSGTIGEEVLERLYSPEALERAFVGTEAISARKAV